MTQHIVSISGIALNVKVTKLKIFPMKRRIQRQHRHQIPPQPVPPLCWYYIPFLSTSHFYPVKVAFVLLYNFIILVWFRLGSQVFE